MKKIRTIIAVFLVLTFAVLPTAVFAKDDSNQCPIVDVPGFMSSTLYKDKSDPNSEVIWPPSTDAILDAVKQCVEPIMKVAVDKDWDSLAKSISDIGNNLLNDALNDNNGNAKGNTGAYFKYPSAASINKNSKVTFRYDWRGDPVKIAADLNDFINYVLESSGCDKVSIECHSLGGVITTSYLSIYGNTKIKSVVFNSTAIYGETYNGELMSGKMRLDSKAVNDYLQYAFDGIEYEALLDSISEILLKSGVYSVVCKLGNAFLDKMLLNVAKGVVMPLFGGWLTIWAMIPDEYMADSMKYVFEDVYGDSEVDHSGLLEKIESYNKLVREKKTQTLTDLNDVANVYVISRYGYSSLPLSQSYFLSSDGVIDTSRTSFGATVAYFGKTLDGEYLSKADPKYISPDKSIDASTCLFPEQTWFIKGLKHATNSDALDEMMDTFARADEQATVNTYAQYPRFLKYSYADDTIVPETESTPLSFFERIKNAVLDLIKLIKYLLSNIIK